MYKKLDKIGIKVKNIQIKREKRGYFEATIVEIGPTPRKTIEDLKFKWKDWTLKPCD